MYMGITYVILLDMFNHLAEKDKKYFRESREQMFNGHKLEDVSCALNATCCNCVQLKLYTSAVGNHAHACSCSTALLCRFVQTLMLKYKLSERRWRL